MLTETQIKGRFDADGQAEGLDAMVELAGLIEAASADEQGDRLVTLDWLRAAALADTALQYKGANLCVKRLFDEIGLEPSCYARGQLDDILALWTPRFKRAPYVHRSPMRDRLPDVRQRGVDVPRNVLVAEMEREARSAKGPELGLMTHLIAVARGERVLPSWNGGPNHTEILRDAGFSAEEALARKGTLGPVVRRWAGFFRIAEQLSVNRNGTTILKRVGRVEIAGYIAILKKEGRRLWSTKQGGISYTAVAMETNLPHTTITNKACKDLLSAFQAECIEADGGVGLGLGPVWPGMSLAERQARRARRQELMQFVRQCVAAGIPLPCRSDRRDAIDFDELVRRSGRPGPSLSDDITFRREIWESGAKVGQSQTPDRGAYDYDFLLQEVPAKRVENVTGKSKAVMMSVTKTAIRKIRDYTAGRDGKAARENRLVGTDFGETPADLEALIDAMKDDGEATSTPSSFASAARYVRNWLEARRGDDGLGTEFCAAVGEAVRRDGRSLTEIVEGTGIAASALDHWVRGESWPSTANRERLPLLEERLGLKGRLTKLLDDDGSWLTGDREGRVLPPGMRPHAADDWRTMAEDEFLGMIDFINTCLLHRNTLHGATQREAAARRAAEQFKRQELGSELAEISDTLRGELDYLFEHMTRPYGTELDRRPKHHWQEGSTGPMKIWQITHFLKWQISPMAEGGLGRDPRHLTLADLVHPPLVFAYIDHRASRFADVEWENKKRGKVVTPAEVEILKISAALIDDEYGFVTQQHDLAARIVPDARKLPAFAFVDHRGRPVRDEIAGEENPQDSGIDIMPAKLAELNEKDFLKSLRSAEKRYRQGIGDLELIADSMRDPLEPVQSLLDHDRPYELLLKQLKTAGERRPNKTRRPYQYHSHVLGLMTNIIFAVTTLRSSNVCEILVDCPDANLVWDAKVGKWLLQIHYRQFKNYQSGLIFGRKFNREWYRNYLPDVLDLYALIDQYRNESRPFFVEEALKRDRDKRIPDNLLITSYGNPYERTVMWHMVFDFTARHVAGNPYRGTGVPGCQPFGPHCYRDIRATDILKNPKPGVDPFMEGAIALQTSPRMIHDHYGRVRSEDRNREVQDRIFEIDRRLKGLC